VDDGGVLVFVDTQERGPFGSWRHVHRFIAEADGRATKIDRFELKPVKWWKSPHSGGSYPVEWEITIPDRQVTLSVRARMPDQELSEEPFAYWEGAVSATGSRQGKEISGKGYLEMTGYAGRIVGMQASD
jgi:predicted secreted hydrolase